MDKDKLKQKRILSTREAAEYLGIVGPRTLEKWRRNGKGPRFVDIEGVLGYLRTDLDLYIEERVKDPGDGFAA